MNTKINIKIDDIKMLNTLLKKNIYKLYNNDTNKPQNAIIENNNTRLIVGSSNEIYEPNDKIIIIEQILNVTYQNICKKGFNHFDSNLIFNMDKDIDNNKLFSMYSLRNELYTISMRSDIMTFVFSFIKNHFLSKSIMTFEEAISIEHIFKKFVEFEAKITQDTWFNDSIIGLTENFPKVELSKEEISLLLKYLPFFVKKDNFKL